MNRLFQGISAVSVIVAIAPTLVLGCTFADSTRMETTQRVGTVQLSLTGVGISGAEYRLRNANFGISGASVASFSSEDHLDEATVRLTLRTGAYVIDLHEGWNLERRTAGGYEGVQAVLLSNNPIPFTILDQETTRVSFRFEAAGDVVNVSGGTLDVSIEVIESHGVNLQPGIAMDVDQQNTWIEPGVATGDLNGDGWADIVLTHGSTSGAIVLNQHHETFAPEVLLSESWWHIQASIGATGVTLTDLDLDGDLDYVFGLYGDHYDEKKIQVYEGDGHGNYAIPSKIPNGLVYELNGANPMANRVADFDHNGLPDIVSGSNNGAHSADIILQTSPWVFTPSYAYNQNGYANPQWIDVGDFNNDGWMDLVVPFLYGPVEVYLNTANGTGAMTYAGGYLSQAHHQVAVGDFDGNGFQDIAARSDPEYHVDVLYNDGTGHFPNAATFAVSGSSGALVAGDLDGDGTLDLVVCSISASTLDIFLNDGMGAFHTAVPIVLDEPPHAIALDDFDHDGGLDVAAYTKAGETSGHIRVLWNRR